MKKNLTSMVNTEKFLNGLKIYVRVYPLDEIKWKITKN